MTEFRERELQVCPPIHRLGSKGKWIRECLVSKILSGTPVLLRIQALRTPTLDSFMKIVSYLGEEEFYTVFGATIVWNVDYRMGRLLVFLMALSFCVTGYLKNLLCLPRPPFPPVVPMLPAQDWAFPSHHSVLCVTIPWYICLYIYIHYSWSVPVLAMVFIGVSIWCLLIMFCRMYLGVHSPADILAGGLIGCCLLVMWLQVDTAVDNSLSSVAFLSWVTLGYAVILCFHPDPLPTSIVFVETCCMTAMAFGFVIGSFASARFSLSVSALLEGMPLSLPVVVLFLARIFLGFSFFLLVKAVSTPTSRIFLQGLFKLAGIETVHVKRKSEVTSARVHYSRAFQVIEKVNKLKVSCGIPLLFAMYLALQENQSNPAFFQRPINLDVPVRLITYTISGIISSSLIPALFNYFRI